MKLSSPTALILDCPNSISSIPSPSPTHTRTHARTHIAITLSTYFMNFRTKIFIFFSFFHSFFSFSFSSFSFPSPFYSLVLSFPPCFLSNSLNYTSPSSSSQHPFDYQPSHQLSPILHSQSLHLSHTCSHNFISYSHILLSQF